MKKIDLLKKSVTESVLARIIERPLGLIKGLVMTAGILSLSEADAYFIQLATISLIFGAWLNAVEYSVNKCVTSSKILPFHLSAGMTIAFLPILLSIYSGALYFFDIDIQLALLFTFHALLYALSSSLCVQARFQSIYWNNHLSETFQAIFICIGLWIGAIGDLTQLMLLSLGGQIISIYFIYITSGMKKRSAWGLEIMATAREIIKILPDLINGRFFAYYFITFLWALNFAVDRYLYDSLSVNLVAISGLAFSLILVPVQLLNLEKISLLTLINLSKENNSQNFDAALEKILLTSLVLSIACIVGAAMFGRESLEYFLQLLHYPEKNLHRLSDIFFVYLIGLIPIMMTGVFDQIFTSINKMPLVVLRVITSIIINVILSLSFVFFLGLDITGIALATSISFWLILAAELIYLFTISKPLAVRIFRYFGALFVIFVLVLVGSQFVNYRVPLAAISILTCLWIYFGRGEIGRKVKNIFLKTSGS